MGDVRLNQIRFATHPVVKNHGVIHREPIDAHPDVEQIRQDLHLDIGKLDYCEPAGEMLVFDVNKTITAGGPSDRDSLEYFFSNNQALESLLAIPR